MLVDREDSLLHNVPYSRYQLATGSGVNNLERFYLCLHEYRFATPMNF